MGKHDKYSVDMCDRCEKEPYDRLAEQNERMLALIKKWVRNHDAGDICHSECEQARQLIAEMEGSRE